MFFIFNNDDDFFQSLNKQQKGLSFKSPNGGQYSYYSNMMDEKVINDYKKKLEQTIGDNDQESFDRIWKSLMEAGKTLKLNQDEVKQIQSGIESFSKEISSLFADHLSSLKDDEKEKEINQKGINEQIKMHEEKIEELKQLQIKLTEEQEKENKQQEILKLKEKLDDKLLELSKHLDNEEIVNELKNELVDINQKIKSLEKEISEE